MERNQMITKRRERDRKSTEVRRCEGWTALSSYLLWDLEQT